MSLKVKENKKPQKNTDLVHTSPFKNLKSGVGVGPFERFLLYYFFCDL